MVKKVGMGGARSKPRRWEDDMDPDETLLWQGAPVTGLRFSGSGLASSIFGSFFLGFSLFWVIMAAGIGAEGALAMFFPFFGAPFVLIGLWLVFGHWFFDAYKRKNTRYAITNKRAMIARNVFGRRMESYPVNPDSNIQLIQRNLDTVNFHQTTRQIRNTLHTVNIGFHHIRDGKKAYDILREVQAQNQ